MNKKGFTMVELLTTLVILGIIVTVGMITVTKVLDSARSSHYSSSLKTIRVAAASYYSDNNDKLPKVLGQKATVTVKTLIDSKYLDSVKDHNDKKCDYVKSKVDAYKVSNSNYKYITTLVCEKYDNSKTAVPNNLKIRITLTKTFDNASDKLNIESFDGIKSYRYRIYKNSVLLYDSGIINGKASEKIETQLKYKDKVNNGSNIRVVASATDVYGNTIEASKSVVIENKNAPLCGKNIKGASTTWINGDRQISIDCVNNNGINCKQKRYSQKFSETTKFGYITIEGDNGVNSDCQVNAYIDKVKPSCEILSNNTKPTFSLVLTINGKDKDSEIATKGYSWNNSTFDTTKTRTIEKNGIYMASVKDVAGNVGNCNFDVTNIYRKPNKPTITNPTNGWVNYNFSLTVKTTTEESQLGYWYYSYDNANFTRYDSSYGKQSYVTTSFSAERNQAVYVRVCNKGASGPTDNVNCSDSASTTIKIDKTKPIIISSSTSATSDTGYKLSVSASDGGSVQSGLNIMNYASSSTYISNGSAAVTVSAGTKTEFYVIDKAGNISDVQSVSPVKNNYNVSNHCWTVNLSTAISCANAGDTIYLITNNYTDDTIATFSKNLTFNIQGNTLIRDKVLLASGAGVTVNFTGNTNGKIEIKNADNNLIKAQSSATANVSGPITLIDNGQRSDNKSIVASHSSGIINISMEKGKIISSDKAVGTDGGTFHISNMPNGYIYGKSRYCSGNASCTSKSNVVVWAKSGGNTNTINNVNIVDYNSNNGTVRIESGQIIEFYDGVKIYGSLINMGKARIIGSTKIDRGTNGIAVENYGDMSIKNASALISNNSRERGTFKNAGNTWFDAGTIENKAGGYAVFNTGMFKQNGGNIFGAKNW